MQGFSFEPSKQPDDGNVPICRGQRGAFDKGTLSFEDSLLSVEDGVRLKLEPIGIIELSIPRKVHGAANRQMKWAHGDTGLKRHIGGAKERNARSGDVATIEFDASMSNLERIHCEGSGGEDLEVVVTQDEVQPQRLAELA